MRNKKWIVVLLIIVIIAAAVFTLTALKDEILTIIINHAHETRKIRKAFPEDGLYYCKELDITLSFSNSDITATYATGESVSLHTFVDGSATFFSIDFEFLGNYDWNQKKDIITLRFRKLPADFEPKAKYVFERIA